jgi:D-galactarolactone isomerase
VLVNPDISDAALEDFHARGVRGMRVYLGKNRVPSINEARSMAERAKALGWSLQFVGSREREVLVDWAETLLSLPCPIVIDHFGWAPQPAGVNSATAKLLFELLAGHDAYVKLSGLYLSSRVGWPDYSDLDELAIALIEAAPDQIIWGTDWPHPMAGEHKPDDARMLDRLAQWAPDAAIRRQILVDNPNRLYWAN